jgi:trimethylamine--corrinoid protein Co-methyltransferase
LERRSRSARRRAATRISQPDWRPLQYAQPPFELLEAGQVAEIIEAALDVLEQHGMRFLDAESRGILRRAGAEAGDAMMVRFDRAMVRELVALAPAEFPLRARNPERDLRIGGRHLVFSSVGGPAYCNDLDRGRRPGTHAELCEYLRLVQGLNILHQEGGGAFEALDLPPESRHLDLYLAQLTLLDKNAQAYPLGRARTVDCLEMTAIALATNRDGLARSPAVLGVINTNSPRQLDAPMSEAVLELAAAGQVCCITPFTLAGSMSPVTLAGTLVQQTAEVLAVVVLAQAVRPGAPVMYGAFASNVDMRSGAPALGTPEYSRMTIASGQLARALGLPFRSSNTTSANCVDAQSAYESEMSLWACALGHANLVNHAAGWLEGGLTASFEKLVVDAEMLQMLAATLRPIETGGEELALDAIAAVPPGGHHFGTAHTLARYRTAFYPPLLSSRLNFEAWQEAGGRDAAMRANGIWKQMLEEYQRPPIDAAVEDALGDYVERRKREIAAATG